MMAAGVFKNTLMLYWVIQVGNWICYSPGRQL
jgi:hypothetical protein